LLGKTARIFVKFARISHGKTAKTAENALKTNQICADFTDSQANPIVLLRKTAENESK
jgi:hypothetical protein